MPPARRMTATAPASGTADPRHVGGAAFAEQPVEGVAPIDRVAARHQGVGNLRTADGLARLPRQRRDQAAHVDGTAEIAQPFADRRDPRDALRALLQQKRVEIVRSGIDEVAEHVDVAPVLDRGDLDAVARAERPASGGRRARRRAAGRVVIGDADRP